MAIFDAVFEGGGAKGIALSGGVSALLGAGHTLRRLVGTSAGAITATNLAVGYTPEEVLAGSTAKGPDGKSVYAGFMDPPGPIPDDQLLDSAIGRRLAAARLPLVPVAAARQMDLVSLRTMSLLPGFNSMFSLAEDGGWYAGDAFLNWMRALLDADGRGYGNATFAELYAATGRDLTVIAANTTLQTVLVLNHRTAPELPVAWGVRMSMSIPFLWREVRWKAEWGPYLGRDIVDHAVVDGGVISNFPLRLFVDATDGDVLAVMGEAPAERAEIVGFRLDAQLPVKGQEVVEKCKADFPLIDRVTAVVDTLMGASDNLVARIHRQAVCRLPVQGYGVTEFDMSDTRVKALYDAGAVAAQQWLTEHGHA